MNTIQIKKPEQKIWNRMTLILFGLFLFLGLFRLAERPFHNDEGVNAVFLQKLIQDGNYKYNPANFHGPSLYYIHRVYSHAASLFRDGIKNFKLTSISGLTEWDIRVPVFLASFLVLVLVLASRSRIGWWGSLTGAFLLSTSADFLFFGRYFIHEIYLVLFIFGLYLSIAKLKDTKRPVFLYLAAACISLALATKETAPVHFFILAFSYFCTVWTHALLTTSTKNHYAELKEIWPKHLKHVALSILLGLGIWAVLFTSFFNNSQGLMDFVRGYSHWGEEGVQSGHIKDFFYYFDKILFPYELPLVLFTFIGIFLSFYKTDKKGIYLAFWTMGTIGAYAVIPYKTPWLILNLLIPMALMSGYGFETLLKAVNSSRKNKTGVGILIIAYLAPMILVFPKTYKFNYVDYDKTVHPQVYQHTDRDGVNLANEIKKIVNYSIEKNDLKVLILTGGYWPLPYYLRELKNVQYIGVLDENKIIDAPLLVVRAEDRPKVDNILMDTYEVAEFLFQQGSTFLLYVNEHYRSKTDGFRMEIPDIFPPLESHPQIKPGLEMLLYKGIWFRGRPYQMKKGFTEINFNWKDYQKKYEAPFSMEMKGYIDIPMDGIYTFSLYSDDGSFLFIDNVLVVDNGGSHLPIKKSHSIRMLKGLHAIKIKYFDGVGEAILKFSWITPEGFELEVPIENLFHD